MPVIFLEKLPEMGLIGVWRISEPLVFFTGLVVLSDAEKRVYDSRQTDLKKCQFLAVRLLLTEMLGEARAVHYYAGGRPYLEGSQVNISVSHSGDLVSVAISPERRIGVDVEKMPRRSLVKGKDYFLNDTEQSQLEGSKNLDQLHIYWSAKEALFKYGADFMPEMKEIFIHPFTLSESGKGNVIGKLKKKDVDQEVSLTYWLTGEYVLVVTGGDSEG